MHGCWPYLEARMQDKSLCRSSLGKNTVKRSLNGSAMIQPVVDARIK